MDDYVHLSATEIVGGRAFTDPERNAEDLVAIHKMTSRLRRLLSQSPGLPDHPRPLVLHGQEDGRRHRVVLCNDRMLKAGVDLNFVGFFAQKRLDIDCSPLTLADDELILELPRHPGIWSYSSLEFIDGNWGNLVILSPSDAKDYGRTSEKHARATRELAPRYYTAARIQNGLLPGGLLSGRDPILVRTKYYDYRGPEPWRAERELRPT